MAEEKNKGKSSSFSFLFSFFTCGCGCIIAFVLILSAFVAGARYGKPLVDRVFNTCSEVADTVSGNLDGAEKDSENGIDKAMNDYDGIYQGK